MMARVNESRLETNPALVEILKHKRAMSEEEAAIYTATSVSFLRKGREGVLPSGAAAPPPFIKVGKSVRYLRDDLDSWLDQFPKQMTTAHTGGAR